MRAILQPDGSLLDDEGRYVAMSEIADTDVKVPHLAPHIIPFVMPKGEVIGLKVKYSSHCWTVNYDPEIHVPTPIIILDGKRLRAFDKTRFDDSLSLRDLLFELAARRVYWTASDRNFGVYNATGIVNGTAYTAFFTLSKERGRFDGARYHLILGVESAYRAGQPSAGMRLKAAAAIDAALNGRKLVYRR